MSYSFCYDKDKPENITFSDDDLKRLKELDLAASIHDKYGNEEIRKAIPALLARLEAAENCLELPHMKHTEQKDDMECTFCYRYKAWLAAKGQHSVPEGK